MKTFKDIRTESDTEIQESRFIRKGTAAVFATRSKRHGDIAIREFNRAKQNLSQLSNISDDSKKIDHLGSALIHMLDGLSSLRHQLGSITSLATTGLLLSERTNSQITKIAQRR